MQRLKNIFFALTKGERVAFVISLAAAIASLAVVMNDLIAQGTTVVPAAGGDYALGMVGQPEYVNPAAASTPADETLVKLLFSNLYDVADKIDESPDGRTWTVRLKENLRWQDGDKLTSDDVIFTVQSIQDQNARSALYARFEGVAASRVSELELQFNLANPYAYFADNLRALYIIPKHLFADTPPANWRLSDYNLKPVGSGPYEFVSYEKRPDGVISAYHLRASPNYFGTKPLIQNLDLQFFNNPDDMVKSFNAGQIDGMSGLNASDLDSIERPYDLSSWRTSSYYAIFFNESKNLGLQDPAVRAALNEAADRDALVVAALAGLGKPQTGPVPEDAPYYAPTLVTSSLDLASSTLDDAGWKAGNDGFRVKTVQKTAVPLALNLTAPQIPFLMKTAQMLQAAWKKIGVNATIAPEAPADILGTTIKNRDYEALLFGNILGPSSDLYAFWNSSQRFYPGFNLAIYNNSKVDALITAASTEIDDAKRASDAAQAEALIAADEPAIFLYSPNYLYVTSKGLRGIAPHFLSDPSDIARDVPSWYLNTTRVLK